MRESSKMCAETTRSDSGFKGEPSEQTDRLVSSVKSCRFAHLAHSTPGNDQLTLQPLAVGIICGTQERTA